VPNPLMLLALTLAVTLAGGAKQTAVAQDQSTGILREATRLSLEALNRIESGTCSVTNGCDQTTGCLAPKRPVGAELNIFPSGGRYDQYVRDLALFHACRERVLSGRRSAIANTQLFTLNVIPSPDAEFAKTVFLWNDNIFWAPASQSTNVITRFGDEARSVFGPIPDADCTDGVSKTLALEVEGNIVDLKPNPNKPNNPLGFEHRSPDGKIVKWTDSIPECDKPSLAGGVTFCGLNTRLTRAVRGNVEWLFFCRKAKTLELTADPSWQATNPTFPLLGTIGFNKTTGEVVYFDGREDKFTFDWSRPFIAAGGHGYSDASGRAQAENIYHPTFKIECSVCHDNKNSHIIDPHIEHARAGYLNGETDPIALAFSVDAYLPDQTAKDTSPFRIIGSSYTSTFSAEIAAARTVRDPTGNCRGCHTLTNQVTGIRFAADAVDKPPSSSDPTVQNSDLFKDEIAQYDATASHRTKWALRTGAGRIHPWMVPRDGNDISESPTEISDADWHKLSDCLWGSGGADCGYKPLYSACPAPESGLAADPAGPQAIAATLIAAPQNGSPGQKAVRLSWKYQNILGGVPERDDVRFNVAVKEAAVPLGGTPPSPTDYPSAVETQDGGFAPISGEIGTNRTARLLRNASFLGHTTATDPSPTAVPRTYQIDIPAVCGKRYLVRIVPKRFCFDQSNVVFSAVDHTAFVDVSCQ
jgi:hypothetical protein